MTRVTYLHDFKKNRGFIRVSIYHKMITPIIFILRIFGIYPYQKVDGEIRFRYKSTVFLYCIVLYVLELAISVYTISSSYRYYTLKRFDVVQIYMVVCLSAIPVCTSPLIWLSGHKLEEFFKHWMNFQSNYNYVMRSSLRCKGVKRMIIKYASVYVIVYSVFFAVIDIVDDKWFRLVFCAMCVLFHSLFMTLYVMSQRVFKTTMDHYNKHLRISISSNDLGSYLIEEYRLTWVSVSQMVQEFGGCFSLMLTLHLVLHSLMFVLLVYSFVGSAAHLLKVKNYLQLGKLFIAPWIPFSMIYVCCNIGHLITKHCTENIPQLIVEMKSKLLNFKNENTISIKLFLYAVTDFKPTVNILGYFEINRPLFGSIISVLVTYMIVLVQFGNN